MGPRNTTLFKGKASVLHRVLNLPRPLLIVLSWSARAWLRRSLDRGYNRFYHANIRLFGQPYRSAFLSRCYPYRYWRNNELRRALVVLLEMQEVASLWNSRMRRGHNYGNLLRNVARREKSLRLDFGSQCSVRIRSRS
jgi:hypothetical protein